MLEFLKEVQVVVVSRQVGELLISHLKSISFFNIRESTSGGNLNDAKKVLQYRHVDVS